MKRAFVLAAALAVAIWLGQASAATFTVRTTSQPAFDPASLSIAVGDTVSWAGITGLHTVTANNGEFDSDRDFAFTFQQPGSYPYFCRVHPGMNGTVTVQQSQLPTSTPTNTPAPVPTQVPGQPRQFVPLLADTAGIGSGHVAVYQGTFLPKTLEVAAGTRVVWHDQATSHTVTSDQGLFDSGILTPGQEFAYTFSQPGTYPYHCTLHGAPGGVGHAGTVIVR
jgi:plastocyanin